MARQATLTPPFFLSSLTHRRGAVGAGCGPVSRVVPRLLARAVAAVYFKAGHGLGIPGTSGVIILVDPFMGIPAQVVAQSIGWFLAFP